MSLLIGSTTEIDWREKYAKQVHDNEQLITQVNNRDNHIKAQNKIIDEQDREIESQKIKEKERLILYIPFTEIGISKDHAIGFLIGFVVFKVL